jgi:hypothetical protein
MLCMEKVDPISQSSRNRLMKFPNEINDRYGKAFGISVNSSTMNLQRLTVVLRSSHNLFLYNIIIS